MVSERMLSSTEPSEFLGPCQLQAMSSAGGFWPLTCAAQTPWCSDSVTQSQGDAYLRVCVCVSTKVGGRTTVSRVLDFLDEGNLKKVEFLEGWLPMPSGDCCC